ncbi:C2 family cysteine protease [Lysobacter sp. CA199]|uniref:C2 family cysteine protease n=1 Tax=Lysobacter sp. CA199 TaxID=3455608 RepID=UPI003F8D6D5F
MPDPRFTQETLYGPGGAPLASDIDQDRINDCYLLAPMSALATQQPQRLQDAIRYDANTQSFEVTLYKEGAKGMEPVNIQVDQADLEDNLTRRGGSAVDNQPGTNGPIWPAVMETAYAELQDMGSRDANYAAIDMGHPSKAMAALTGQPGESLGQSDVAALGADATYERLRTALDEKRPVTLGTFAEDIRHPDDGLVDRHMYVIEGVQRGGADGKDVVLDLRNPLAENSALEGRDNADATTTVTLDVLDKSATLGVIHIGPTPLPPQSPKPETPAGDARPESRTGDRHLDALLDSLGDPARFKQAMGQLYDSPDGQAMRQQGRELSQESAQREAPALEQTAAQQQAPTMDAPVRSLSR